MRWGRGTRRTRGEDSKRSLGRVEIRHSHAFAGRRIVVVDVGGRVVLLELIRRAAPAMAMEHRGVVVLVGVVVGLMLELARRMAEVAVRDVIVVVGVQQRLMAVLLANVTQHLLIDARGGQGSPP